jgi:hypothetical protein
MISKEKKDYKVGDKIFIISYYFDYFIEEMEVEKIGSKFMYLSNQHRYEFGEDYTTIKWSYWTIGYYLRNLFTDKAEAEKEAYKRNLTKEK